MLRPQTPSRQGVGRMCCSAGSGPPQTRMQNLGSDEEFCLAALAWLKCGPAFYNKPVQPDLVHCQSERVANFGEIAVYATASLD